MIPLQSIQVSASLLSANFLLLGQEIEQTVAAGVDSFHLDIMDGHLAPNLSYGPAVVKAIRSASALPMDAHLMIDQPWLFLDDYISLGVTGIFIHAESYDTAPIDPAQIKQHARFTYSIDQDNLIRDLKRIRHHGIQSGVTLNLKTPADCILPVLSYCDQVLVMSIDPGFAGQTFKMDALPKISQIRRHFSGNIVVDGGVNDKTAESIVKAGANVLVSASYLYGSSDYRAAIDRLKVIS